MYSFEFAVFITKVDFNCIKYNFSQKLMARFAKNILEYKHGYHLVDPSPWPLLTAFSAFILTSGGVLYMHSYKNGYLILGLGLFLVVYSVTC
jgi:hypothetical protein